MNIIKYFSNRLIRSTKPSDFLYNENFIKFMGNEKINSFGKWMFNNGYNAGVTELAMKLNNHFEWISVKDRLPDDHEDVLVWFEYFRHGDYGCLCQTYGIGNYLGKTWFVHGSTGWKQLRVIAWHKLPEPPKGE